MPKLRILISILRSYTPKEQTPPALFLFIPFSLPALSKHPLTIRDKYVMYVSDKERM